MLWTDPLLALLTVRVMTFLIILIPLLLISMLIISFCMGAVTYLIARPLFEWWHGEPWDVYGGTWIGTLYRKLLGADEEAR